MVRYSKLPARMLYSRYEAHIVYTPMILAREYASSEKARQAEFKTNDQERGTFTQDGRIFRGALVAQFAAKKASDFADAVELIHPYVDGVDLNCGW
jgi:tRNA-dihydrouridine synthase 4